MDEADEKQKRLLELLFDLRQEQLHIGHGGLGLSFADVKWDLERLLLDSGEQFEIEDAALEESLNSALGWRPVAEGWQLFDEEAGERVQTTRLKERRSAAAAPVAPTRRLGALVHLLRDPAYGEVRMSVKMQQLAHICANELQQLDAGSLPLKVFAHTYTCAWTHK